MKITRNILAETKLFEGLCLSNINDITNDIKINFLSMKAGRVVKNCNDKCNELIFLIKGEIISELYGKNSDFKFVEKYTKSHIIEPYSLFGREPSYKRKYTTLTDVEAISIDKRYILELLNKYEVFNMNYMNMLCTYTQNFREKALTGNIPEIKDKILQMAIHLSETYTGDKILYIKKETLANIINETRIQTAKALEDLKEEGKLQTTRGKIVFHENIFTNKQYISDSIF